MWPRIVPLLLAASAARAEHFDGQNFNLASDARKQMYAPLNCGTVHSNFTPCTDPIGNPLHDGSTTHINQSLYDSWLPRPDWWKSNTSAAVTDVPTCEFTAVGESCPTSIASCNSAVDWHATKCSVCGGCTKPVCVSGSTGSTCTGNPSGASCDGDTLKQSTCTSCGKCNQYVCWCADPGSNCQRCRRC